MGRGAIDLSALKRPAPQQAPTGGGGGAMAGAGGSSYAVAVDEENFQAVLQASTTAPVVLVFHSPSQAPESSQMAEDVADLVGQYDGRFLAGIVDVDAVPQIAQVIAQASQLPQLPVPLLMVFLDGRPAIQPIPGMVSREELSTLFNQLGQQLTAQGITGRHQPLAGAAAPAEGEAEVEPGPDPRYAPAQDALASGDLDLAVAEYQKLADANPADAEASAGLAMAKILQRTQGVDLTTARAAAAASPDDVDAQIMVADLDLLGGHVEDAFARLVELVRRTSDKERDRAREHLVGLFAAVGNEDPRVLKGRQALASALF
jgi:putative thioredoxin